MKGIVTGGARFIGPAVRGSLVAAGGWGVNIDKLADAANPASQASIADRSNDRLVKPSSEESTR